MYKKIDALGRVGIPKNIREEMALFENTLLWVEYDTEKDQIVLKKAAASCASCGKEQDLFSLKNNFFLCKNCLEQLKKQENPSFSEKERLP